MMLVGVIVGLGNWAIFEGLINSRNRDATRDIDAVSMYVQALMLIWSIVSGWLLYRVDDESNRLAEAVAADDRNAFNREAPKRIALTIRLLHLALSLLFIHSFHLFHQSDPLASFEVQAGIGFLVTLTVLFIWDLDDPFHGVINVANVPDTWRRDLNWPEITKPRSSDVATWPKCSSRQIRVARRAIDGNVCCESQDLMPSVYHPRSSGLFTASCTVFMESIATKTTHVRRPGMVRWLRFSRLVFALLLTLGAVIAIPVLPALAATCQGRTVTISGSGLIAGTSGDDVIQGSALADQISGNGGDDYICSLGGNDKITAGFTGAATLMRAPVTTNVTGSFGNDTLRGGPGNTNFADSMAMMRSSAKPESIPSLAVTVQITSRAEPILTRLPVALATIR